MNRGLQRLTILAALHCAAAAWTLAQPLDVSSPSGELRYALAVGEDGGLVYEASFRGRPVVERSALGLQLEGGRPLGENVRVAGSSRGEEDETYEVPHGKSNPVRNRYNWLRVELEERGARPRRLTIEARAYDDGLAFRYVIPDQERLRAFRIRSEMTEFRIAKDATTYPMALVGMRTNYESENDIRPLTSVLSTNLIGLPLLMEIPGTAWVAVTEAHLEDYAGMYLARDGENARTLRVKLSPRPDEPEVAVIGATPHASPWRVLMIADDPGRLLESNLIVNLNPPSRIADTSWILPGRAAWNWWSGNVVDGQPFEGGMNTATMKYYIDFAAEAGFEYMLIDAGWSGRARGEGADITTTIPEIDMPEILRHAKSKNVKVWLWLYWSMVDKQMDEAFPLYEKWGVAGVKIDFMDRDDQWMVDYYHRVLEKAAEHRLMVDFHGAYKPTGIRRTYPNLMTREGVLGLEYSKWSARANPEHNVTIPFTRMLAGPMDYTPGGFDNATREQFESRSKNPMVLGTRTHHLASLVVFESALLVLADHPGAYRDPPSFSFVKAVPASWDETRVVNARVGDYVTVARRHGEEWFVGAMTDWTGRELEIPLDFLGEGRFSADVYMDAPEADSDPKRTAIERDKPVSSSTTLNIRLASGGGCAIYIRRR